MTHWTPWQADAAPTRWQGIFAALEADIRAGRLSAGSRLPPHRQIAAALGADITTVTRALNEAKLRGLVEAQVGRGTFVRRHEAPDTAEAGPVAVDLSMNMPPQPRAAALESRIPEGIAALLSAPGGLAHLHYQASTGRSADRSAAAHWLAPRLGPIPAERVIVAPGAQAALHALCDLLPAGDGLCAGSVTYPGLRAVADRRGLALHPLAMDAQGVIPEAFAARCRIAVPRALYLVPTIDNPTTATMPAERREAIVAIAREHDVALIEDDAYGALTEAAPPSIAALAPERTWHLATLSKCATPALRIAYAACPTGLQAQRLADALRTTSLMAPPLSAALASRWIADGTLADITAEIRRENRARQAVAAAALAGLSIAAAPDGPHLWLSLPAPWRAADYAARAERSGLAIVPGAAFSTGRETPEAVRISLGLAPDLPSLEAALRRLRELLDQAPFERRPVV